MLKDFVKEVVVIVVGKNAEPIAELIDAKKHVNEFIIAKKMEITINQTRNILYKLSDYGLVSSVRKKDKKKGWYTYFWKIEHLRVLEFLKEILEKKIFQFETQIKNRETKQFYICKTCNLEFNEEDALLKDFTCNECGGIFTIKDNAKLLREFNRNTSRLKKQLGDINIELKKLMEKFEKEKIKEEAKNKAERKLVRQKAAQARALVKKLEEEKYGKKKVVKKKVVKKKVVKKKVVKKKVISKGKKTPKGVPRRVLKKTLTRGKKVIKKKGKN